MLSMDDPWTAWAAGFFEGEGSFSLQKNKKRYHQPAYRHRPIVSLPNTDLDVLERFQNVVKIGNITSRQVRPNCKPIWTWQATGVENFQKVVDLLLPWLSDRRKERAAEILAEAAIPPDCPKFRKEWTHSEETKKKMSIAQQQRWADR